jgi:squalene synthase HpnD
MSDAVASDGTPPAAQRAAGSSFYAAMRIMPRAQREAMFEIYAFCRAVDDIADNPGPRDQHLAQLQRWRDDIDTIYAGQTPPHLQGLTKIARECDLARADFIAVIDGMEMDVVSTICAPNLLTLDLYCDRVASAVGRLSVRVFGMARDEGLELAHHLGRALQLTNILRDIDEDAEIGRVYLPREGFDTAGIAFGKPNDMITHPAIGIVCDMMVARVRGHFAQSEDIMARSQRAMVRAPRIMGAAYSLILERLVARGWKAPRQPVKLRRSQLLWILLRHAIV